MRRGRKDRQIQLSGQRLELDEIEKRATHALGRNEVAVALCRGILTLFHEAGDPDELKLSLSQTLPPAWRPQRYVRLEPLPRTAAHKIDYPALQAHSHDLPVPQDSLSLLATALELERSGHRLQSVPDATYLRGETLLQTLPALAPTSIKPFARRSRLLVTGGGGRLGRALIPLLESRFEVWTLQRKPFGSNCLQGDLTRPQFGLASDEWDFLRNQIDEIVHLAARLELTADYAELAPLNTFSLVRLAELEKPIHFASSLAAVLSTSRPGLDHPLDSDAVITGGYAQSKWAAEALLKRLPLPGYTLRFGQLLQAYDSRDWLGLVVRGLLQFGCLPVSSRKQPLCFDFTPTIWAARETARLLAEPAHQRELRVVRRGWDLHLLDLVNSLKACGRELAQVPAELFFAKQPATLSQAAAQSALWRLHPNPQGYSRPNYDLFLLGDLGQAENLPDEECLEAFRAYLRGAL